MGVFKKLLSDTALYGISSIIGRMLNYFLVPLYTTVFATGEYGIVTELYAYTAFFNIIFTYGMETAYFRYASKKEENALNIYRIILSSIISSTLFFALLLWIFSGYFAEILEYPVEYLQWLILIVSIDAILAIPYAKLRQEGKAKLFAFTKIANISITIFLNVFFLVICADIFEGKYLQGFQTYLPYFYDKNLGVGYVFLSNLIANAFVFLLLYRSFLAFKFVWNWKKLKPIFLYAYPLLFMGLAAMANTMLDKIFLKYYLPEGFYPEKTSLEVLGMYGAVQKLAVFMTLVVQAFRYAAEPFFFSKAEDRQAPELFAKVMHYFVIAGVMILLLVSLNTDILEIIFLRREEYREGVFIIPILLLANLFLGIYFNLSVWYKITDHTYFGTWITAGGAIITVLGNMILIPIFGYLGAALANLLTYFSMSIVCYAFGQKYFKIPYKVSKAFLHIFIGLGITFLSMQFSPKTFFYSIPFHLFLFLIYLIFVLVLERKNLPKRLRFF